MHKFHEVWETSIKININKVQDTKTLIKQWHSKLVLKNRAARVQDNNRVHTVNKRKWTSEEKKEWCKSIEKNDRKGIIS